jgi:hypothetical protein
MGESRIDDWPWTCSEQNCAERHLQQAPMNDQLKKIHDSTTRAETHDDPGKFQDRS